jgi:hypothetical protein
MVPKVKMYGKHYNSLIICGDPAKRSQWKKGKVVCQQQNKCKAPAPASLLEAQVGTKAAYNYKLYIYRHNINII